MICLLINKPPLELKRIFREQIEYLFRTLNSKVINISKLYARLRIMNNEDIKKLGVFNSDSNIFFIVSYILSREYVFKKPFIAKDDTIILSNAEIILNFISSFDEFTVKEINDFSDKMHLKRIESYLKLFDELADEYVQIDMDKFIKKTMFDMEQRDLEKLNKEIKYYINSFGNIDSEKFQGYEFFPRLIYQWNKYLLCGLVRSFLSDEFKIEYSNNVYKKLSYIISPKGN